ncbi:MAG: peptidylprolyl isomerase [Betaproteobacteria bacterium]|jgi:Parvulin-like peptidyl-prolyl isomerase|nr:peptidylprolyl isomerase [Betaproteobacteria bacterium]
MMAHFRTIACLFLAGLAPLTAIADTPPSPPQTTTPTTGVTPSPEVAAPASTSPTPSTSGEAAPAADEEQPHPVVDRIVAIINNHIITESELDERVTMITSQLNRQGVQLPEHNILVHQILEKMIIDEVQLQYAQDAGIKVDDTQLDQAMVRLAGQNKLTLPQFRSEVEKEGVTWEKFREEIRNEIVLSQVREREVENRIFVSDNEINAELAKEKAQGSSRPEELDLAHILITVPENATQAIIDQRHKKAEEAVSQIDHGMPFAQAAAAYSEAPDALSGGDLGWRPSTRLPALFVEETQNLQPGQHSRILRSPNGFHILELVNRRTPDAIPNVSQYHLKQILVRVTPETNPKEAKTKIDTLYARIQGGEDFGKLATLNSEDDSRNRGGDLGWVSEGSTFPQFEKVVKSLKPGEVSQPFETPLGWHILQLEAARQATDSDDGKRMAIRQGLRARKSDESYDDWVRQLRDQAFVDIRLDDH